MILKNPSRNAYAFIDDNVTKFYFNYANWQTCCIAGIIDNFSSHYRLNNSDFEFINDELVKLVSRQEINVLYALDTEGGSFSSYAEKLGFTCVDVNFNNNSGNNVFLFKKLFKR